MLKRVLFPIISILITLFIAEIGLRIAGFETYKYTELDPFYCEPDYWTFDNYLGFCHLPGQYTCYIASPNINVPFKQDYLTFSVNHWPDSSRATHGENRDTSKFEKTFHLYGNSLTWGHGIDDTSTMAWIIQETLDRWKVKNYGIPGGSIVQSYLWLKRNVQNDRKPDIAVINYSSFLHDKRNVWSWGWRKVWQSTFRKIPDSIKLSKRGKKYRVPAARIKQGKLKIKYISLKNLVYNLPLIKTSVIMNIANHAYHNISDMNIDKHKVSQRLLAEMYKYCNKKNIKLLVNGINNDEQTQETLAQLDESGILTSPPGHFCCEKKVFTLEPYDPHPSELTNQLYAYKLQHYLYGYGILK